jgi:hypothetical protein
MTQENWNFRPGALCRVTTPHDRQEHHVQMPSNIVPGGSFRRFVPKKYTRTTLKSLNVREIHLRASFA